MHFKILEQGTRRWLSVEGAWEPRLATIMESHGLHDLRLHDVTPGRSTSVDFLRDLPGLARLSLCVNGPRDWRALYELRSVRVLELQYVTRKLDFTRMPQLEDLTCNWSDRLFSSLCDCEWLEHLGLDYFTGSDFAIFRKLKALRSIGFGFTRLGSLIGIEQFPDLRWLSLGPVNRMETLDYLDACAKLEYLSIDQAMKLKTIDAVAYLWNLQELCFKACPKIESLRSLRGLANLEYFGLLETTSIADGDLSVLNLLPQLKHASIRDRRHYSHKNADFPKAHRRTTKVVTLHQE